MRKANHHQSAKVPSKKKTVKNTRSEGAMIRATTTTSTGVRLPLAEYYDVLHRRGGRKTTKRVVAAHLANNNSTLLDDAHSDNPLAEYYQVIQRKSSTSDRFSLVASGGVGWNDFGIRHSLKANRCCDKLDLSVNVS